jgi:hypothetical protein
MATHDFKGSKKINTTQARNFGRALNLLIAVERLEKPTLDTLVKKTNLPGRSIYSIIERLSQEYFVVIERFNGRRYGYYKVADWGVLDRERILALQEPKEKNLVGEKQDEMDFQQV